MTLKEWSAKQRYAVKRHAKFFNSFWCPDDSTLIDRAEAWHLDDYIVASVSGGTIWFSPRHTFANQELAKCPR
jgi:hypothetical protein